MADVLHTNPSDWKYVSEGGVKIVFSYVGPPHPKFDGRVLQLRKRARLQDHAQSDSGSDIPAIEYQSRCIERLIPPQYLPHLETVALDRTWLEALVALHDSVRPKQRREKDVDLERKKGVLATDLVSGNWLAVEIKVSFSFSFKSLLNLNPKKL